MCVSATASFVAGSTLAVVGVLTIIKALRDDRSMIIFALFPAIFSLHQVLEGVVWLSLGNSFDGGIVTYIYLLIATALWPTLCPLAAFFARPTRVSQVMRYFLVGVGLALSIYQVTLLATASGVEVKVVGHSLSYVIGYKSPPPEFINYTYAFITVFPLLIVRRWLINILGVLAGVAFLYTLLQMREVWYSVWCFSAAVFSAFLYFAIGVSRKSGDLNI
jgi:hypothetical protein